MKKIGARAIFGFSFFLLAGILFDTSIIKISVFRGGLDPSVQGILSFVLVTLIYFVGQFVMLYFVKQVNMQYQSKKKLSTLYLVLLVQYIVMALFIVLALEMIFVSHYSNIIYKLIIDINYCLSIVVFGLLAIRFFTWFKNRRNLVLIFYAITMSVICLNLVCTLLYVMNSLTGQRGIDYIVPLKGLMSIVVGVKNTYSNLFYITSIASFCSIWASSILLLFNYSRNISATRLLLLFLIPFVYFLGEFQPFLITLFESVRVADPVLFGIAYTLFFSATKPVGAILFGVTLWNIGSKSQNQEFRAYMVIAAIGIIILVASNQPGGLVLAPYPPFGLVTISLLGLSSYLFFTGISYSAVSVANKKELRSSIRKSFHSKMNLIHDIGAAHMEETMEKTVKKINNNLSEKIANETGVEVSLDEQEIKEMVRDIVGEIRLSKNKKT